MAGSVVQLVGNDNGSAGTTLASGAFAGNVTAGNIIQVAATAIAADTITLSKNAGTATIGTPTLQVSGTEAGTGTQTQWWTIPVTGTGTLDVLGTWNTSQSLRAISCAEVAGVASVDSAIPAPTGDSGNNPTGTLTDTVIAAPAFGVMQGVDVQGGTLTAGAGWTSVGSTGSSADKCTTQTKSIASTGATTGNFANAGFDRNNSAIIVYVEIGLPSFTTQPSNLTIPDGATATFTSAAASAGGTGLGYQWQDNSTGSFADISGATSASYTSGVLVASAAAGRQYRCNATDSNGTTASNTVTLNFFAWPRGGSFKKRRRPNGIGWFPGAFSSLGGTGVQNWLLRGLAQAASAPQPRGMPLAMMARPAALVAVAWSLFAGPEWNAPARTAPIQQPAAASSAQQPWLAYTRPAAPRIESETFDVRPAAPTLHRWRTGFQTVGQPWALMRPRPARALEPEAFTASRPQPTLRQVAAPPAQPWLAYTRPAAPLWVWNDPFVTVLSTTDVATEVGPSPPQPWLAYTRPAAPRWIWNDPFVAMLSTTDVATEPAPASGPSQPWLAYTRPPAARWLWNDSFVTVLSTTDVATEPVYQPLGQPWTLLYQRRPHSIEAEAFEVRAPSHSLLFWRAALQTSGQPWSLLFQRRAANVEAEPFEVRAPAPSFPLSRATIQTAAQPWLLYFKRSAPGIEAEAFEVRAPAPSLHLWRTGYQSVGQAWSLLFQRRSLSIEAESFEVRSSSAGLQLARTPIQTAGQPWSLLFPRRSANIEAEAFEVRAPAPSLQLARTATQIAGQPWLLLFQRRAATVDAEAFEVRSPSSSLLLWHAAIQTSGQPWSLLFPKRAANVEAEAFDVRAPAPSLHRWRVGYQTVGQPWLLFAQRPALGIEPESYDAHRAQPFPAAGPGTIVIPQPTPTDRVLSVRYEGRILWIDEQNRILTTRPTRRSIS